MSLLEMWDHSIALYWMIICCGWVGGGALDCPTPQTASEVRMYSLRKPWRTSSFRYHWRLLQWAFLCPLLSW